MVILLSSPHPRPLPLLPTDEHQRMGFIVLCLTVCLCSSSLLAICPAYMAPEVVTQKQVHEFAHLADIWSIGCVVVELMTGKVHVTGGA